MNCPRCSVKCVIYGQINSSGSKVVVERCPKCRCNPDQKRAFLPKADYEWDSLPLFEDYSKAAAPCAVRGCKNVGTEYHHFAPQHLFDDANDWPTAYLCHDHHAKWHELTRTGSYYKRAVAA